ncbi:MAG: ABC transporter substrate-binding protein [Deltaproteobacteria bacterium]|nr:ABC transporter substrate-binding protein [Deltaproteobacteria bacterium]
MRIGRAAYIIAFVSLMLSPPAATAGIPADQLRQTTEKVLLILQDPRLKSPDKKSERREQLRQVIAARFDFSEMAKRSLGPNWPRFSTEEQRQFTQLFTNLLERSYTDQIESFNGEKFVYGRENQNHDQASVETKIVTTKGESLSVNYKLYSSKQEWRVYDVVIEDISLVNNYRSQFNRMLTNSSSEQFLRKLREKQTDARNNYEGSAAGSKS